MQNIHSIDKLTVHKFDIRMNNKDSVALIEIEKELEEQESVVSKSFQDIFSNILTRNSGRSDANAMQDKLTDSMARQRQKRQQMEQSLNANQDKEGRTS